MRVINGVPQSQAIIPHDVRYDTDPYVTPAAACRDCNCPLEGLRVFAGSTAGMRQHRGRICQTCPDCHHSTWHTEAYEFLDAEALLTRIKARRNREPIPQSALDAPLRPAIEPVERGGGKIDCANPQCVTKSRGTRTQGSKGCIEYLCANCCKGQQQTARLSNIARPKCPGHSVAAVVQAFIPALDASQPQPAFQRVNIPLSSQSPNTTEALARPAPQVQIDPELMLSSQNPVRSQPRRAPATSSSQMKSLAQPMGANWSRKREAALAIDAQEKSLKSQNIEMQERMKRTCQLLIWYKNGAEPLRIKYFVKTYPELLLEDLSAALEQCSYRKGSFIQYYSAAEWVTSQLDVVLTVNIAYPILIRLLPSLVEPLVDCPGLEDELKMQPRAKNKRPAADDLISPPKKMSRHNHQDSDSISSQSRDKDTTLRRCSTADVPPLSTCTSKSLLAVPSQRSSIPSKSLAPFPLDLETTVKPEAKAWPRDFYVSEVVDGLQSVAVKMNGHITQALAFTQVFPGVKYNKGQISKVRMVLERVGSKLEQHFVDFGKTPKGKWTNFRDSLPSTILDKGFSRTDSTVIADLEKKILNDNASANDSDSTDRLSLGGDNDDSGLGSPDPDWDYPDQRCAFCDEIIPADFKPSATLEKMRKDLQPLSQPDPIRYFNPNHRKTTSALVYMEHCQRHQLELELWPAARQQGWPTEIKFSTLHNRIVMLRPHLTDLLLTANLNTNEFYLDYQNSFAPGTSRAGAAGVSGLWKSFKGHGTGYYGIEGYQILSLTLELMFPDYEIDETLYQLLTARSLREEILLPEACTQLILQDMPHLTRDAAIEVLRTSQDFGSGLHPESEGIHIQTLEHRLASAKRRERDIIIKIEDEEIRMARLQTSVDEYREVVDNGKTVVIIDD